jgi:hypothetical protein
VVGEEASSRTGNTRSSSSFCVERSLLASSCMIGGVSVCCWLWEEANDDDACDDEEQPIL